MRSAQPALSCPLPDPTVLLFHLLTKLPSFELPLQCPSKVPILYYSIKWGVGKDVADNAQYACDSEGRNYPDGSSPPAY
ncbi:hypothetical protein M404DRAFT_999064 [Pisolithus tinctorius Marx 270]|uniref:Uncharacterized protein n=1 Tax=Pisolithus tinctorius Marx 270 TaxID=870435 RepID=A0A0C3PE23_PISTI|nr:hypothetical protein M404DRAFT_999064 [Pisolithus tinctorius Marx 270]